MSQHWDRKRREAFALINDLDKVRIALNATSDLAGQDSAYGKVAEAMKEIMRRRFGNHAAILLYRTMIESGLTVEEAHVALWP